MKQNVNKYPLTLSSQCFVNTLFAHSGPLAALCCCSAVVVIIIGVVLFTFACFLPLLAFVNI